MHLYTNNCSNREMLSFQMKLQPTTPSLVSSMRRWLHFNVTQVLFFCPIHCTEPRVQHKHYRREKKQQKAKLKLKKKISCNFFPSFCHLLSDSIWRFLSAAEPSHQRSHLRRGHPGRGQRRLLPAVISPPAEAPPSANGSFRSLEPRLQMNNCQ